MLSQILNSISVRTLHNDAETQSVIYKIFNIDNNLAFVGRVAQSV